MQWNYVYADLRLQVTFDAEADSLFAHLTDSEIAALQQLVYHGLMIFSNVRALYAADYAIEKKYRDCSEHKCQCTCHGG